MHKSKHFVIDFDTLCILGGVDQQQERVCKMLMSSIEFCSDARSGYDDTGPANLA